MVSASATLERSEADSGNPYVRGVKRAFRKPQGFLCAVVLIAIVLGAIGAPVFTSFDPVAQQRGAELHAPSSTYLFGTDERGRDLFSRVLYGLRLSLVAGALSALVGGVFGSLVGLFAAVRPGLVSAIVMRTVDSLLAFPALLLGIILVVAFGPGLINITVTLAFINVPVFARLAYAGALAEKARDYVLAAESLGASTPRVVLGHILINALAPLLVQLAMAMGFSVGIEASLSFLGLGIRPPAPSLGSVISGSRNYMIAHVYYPILPSIALGLLLLALNALADTLNDALDPRRINTR